jgi:hypothetical protein
VGIRWRQVRGAEVIQLLSVASADLCDGLVGRKKALEIWHHLADHPYFIAAAIEADPEIEGHSLLALGAACFVQPEFTDETLHNPRPGIHDRLFEAFASQQGIVLDRQEIGRLNAGPGLDIIQLVSTVLPGLSQTAQMEASMALAAAFHTLVQGYKLRVIFRECFDDLSRLYARSGGGVVIEFPGTGASLNYGTRDIVASNPGSAAAVLFYFAAPTLKLREQDQEILLAALDGATDEEIGPVLGLSSAAVKARWRSLWSRIERVRPDWSTPDGEGLGRGPQRRHRVLAYCRQHPEELRPYDWTVAKKPNGSAQPSPM